MNLKLLAITAGGLSLLGMGSAAFSQAVVITTENTETGQRTEAHGEILRPDPKYADGPKQASPDLRNFEGLWTIPPQGPPLFVSANGTNGVMVTITGELPPMRPNAQNTFFHRLDMEQHGTPVANTATTCRPGLPLKALHLGVPFEVIQNDEKIVFLFGQNRRWVIHLNRELPEDLEPTYMGMSVGHFEGPTLVVESAGFNDLSWIDLVGLPHSTKLRLVQRINKIDAGRHLRILTTVDDPDAYTKIWTTAHTANFMLGEPGARIETDCLENNVFEGNAEILFEDERMAYRDHGAGE